MAKIYFILFYHISNKLRECAKFLRVKTLGSYENMIVVLKPENFDNAIEAIKALTRYDPITFAFQDNFDSLI